MDRTADDGEPTCRDCGRPLEDDTVGTGDRCYRCEVTALRKQRDRLVEALVLVLILLVILWVSATGNRSDDRPEDVPDVSCLANPAQPGC